MSVETPTDHHWPLHQCTSSTDPAVTHGPAIELTLPSGERLTIAEGVSAELVRSVLSTLRVPC